MSPKSVQGQIVQDSATDHQKTDARSFLRRAWMAAGVLLIAVGITLWGAYAAGAQDPYVRSVLQLAGDTARGQEIFQLNCATCHGLLAGGEVGPNLHEVSARRSRAALIHQVTSGQTPPMPQFQPNERDMADLLTYLETL